jgi:hypothetical protein
MSKSMRRMFAMAAGCGVLGWSLVFAEVTDNRPPANVKVLPAGMSRAEIRELMEGYERDLGVKCGYCHVKDHDSGAFDYASDESPAKQTTRVMISMLDDINGKYLAQLGNDRRYALPVSCGSCHQGRSTPAEYEAR